MSELTEHGRKALERCIREHQKFIELADDYDLDEMSVQALKTGIESMHMRLDASKLAGADAVAYCRELSELHARVLTEADSMLALAIKAIKAINATHPQPVTPAGGEVECAGTNCHASGANGHKHSTECRFEYASAAASGVKSVTVGVKVDDSVDQIEWRGSIIDLSHPPVADAALAELLSAADEARSILGGLDYYDLRRRLECAIAALNQRGGG